MSDEITRFGPLLDTIVTVEALHCQRDHVTYLAERGADWILTVKGCACTGPDRRNLPRGSAALAHPEQLHWVRDVT